MYKYTIFYIVDNEQSLVQCKDIIDVFNFIYYLAEMFDEYTIKIVDEIENRIIYQHNVNRQQVQKTFQHTVKNKDA